MYLLLLVFGIVGMDGMMDEGYTLTVLWQCFTYSFTKPYSSSSSSSSSAVVVVVVVMKDGHRRGLVWTFKLGLASLCFLR